MTYGPFTRRQVAARLGITPKGVDKMLRTAELKLKRGLGVREDDTPQSWLDREIERARERRQCA